MTITCGIGWAEAHHDVALVDAEGLIIARARFGSDAAGFAALLAMIAERGGTPGDTPVAIETDKNLLVVGLSAAGFRVYPDQPTRGGTLPGPLWPGRRQVRSW
jgi:hypothetical protein